jgi:hypothetical protein
MDIVLYIISWIGWWCARWWFGGESGWWGFITGGEDFGFTLFGLTRGEGFIDKYLDSGSYFLIC